MDKLPNGVDINNLIGHLRIISWEASDILIYYSKLLKQNESNIDIIKNSDFQDPVTLADLKVNELIIHKLFEKYKNINWEILSEENVKLEANTFKSNRDFIWILDPLDGTKDFIQGTGEYAMHLALNYKNVPYIGAVLIPEKNELWLTNGKETWCEKRDGFREIPKISNKQNLKDMTIVTSRNHRNEHLKNLLQKIRFKKCITMGSIGYKITSILRGESDIYISLSLPGKSSPKDWDFAAPEAILKAAGGAVTDLDNNNLVYGKLNFEQGGVIVASNCHIFHESICLEIKEIIQKYKLYRI